jgi:dihydrofolate reductase
MTLSIIVAMTRRGVIGYQNRLPWHIAEDLHHFKQLTWGHTVLMGHTTFRSLPHGALPGRRNIVMSITEREIEGCEVYADLDSALAACKSDDEVFVMGGASIYAQMLPRVRKLYVTWVDQEPSQADTFFPQIDWDEWQETKKEKHDGFSFVEYEKK